MRKDYLLSRLSTSIVKKLLVPVVLLGSYTSVYADCVSYVLEENSYGVDFTPADSTAESLDDVLTHLDNYLMSLSEGDVKSYRIGKNFSELFGCTPYLDRGLQNPNYYMFCKDPEGSLFTLGFSPAYEFFGKVYTFKMSMYIQPYGDCDIEEWKNAKLNAKTNMGNVLKQYVSIQAYGNDNSPFITPTQIYNGGTNLFEVGEGKGVSFTDFLNVDSIGPNDLIRLDIRFEGTFPSDTSLSMFEISPMFENLSCANVAVDFIGSRDVETICISDYVGCAGDVTTAHATGFPLGSKIEFFKQDNDSVWVKIEDVDDDQNAHIAVEKGTHSYLLCATTINGKKIEVGFNVVGNDCTDVNKIDVAEADPIVNVYTVDGAILKSKVRYSEALKDLKKGFYIVGDKKVYVSE